MYAKELLAVMPATYSNGNPAYAWNDVVQGLLPAQARYTLGQVVKWLDEHHNWKGSTLKQLLGVALKEEP